MAISISNCASFASIASAVAKHAGMDILGLSVVSNVNDPDNFEPIILEDIIATAEAMEAKLAQLLIEIAKNI